MMVADRPTRVFLDWNAGAPLRPEARSCLVEMLEAHGNPSSVHAEGRAARAAVEAARAEVGRLAGADPRAVTFTSGASEANATVLTPNWTFGGRAFPIDVLLVSAIEHPSVRAGGRFAADRVEVLPVDGDGIVDLMALEKRLVALQAADQRALVSVMLASNETGVIQPAAEISAIVRAAGSIFHADAVQAAGRVPIDLAALGADAITLSGHKIGAPRGTGAIVRTGLQLAFEPLIRGGGQEMHGRAGTENVAAIAAFGVAARAAMNDLNTIGEVGRLRDLAIAAVRRLAPDAVVFAKNAPRLANTLGFAVPGLAAETALIAFDLAGIALSSGAACSSGKVGESQTLKAMGVSPTLLRGGLRVSLGPTTRESDIDAFARTFETVCRSLKGQGRSMEQKGQAA